MWAWVGGSVEVGKRETTRVRVCERKKKNRKPEKTKKVEMDLGVPFYTSEAGGRKGGGDANSDGESG